MSRPRVTSELAPDTRSALEALRSFDGPVVAGDRGDGFVTLVTLMAGDVLGRFGFPSRADVRSIAFTGDGSALLAGTSGSVLRRWAVAGEPCETTIKGTHQPVRCVAPAKSGRWLAVASHCADRSQEPPCIRLHDATTLEILHEGEPNRWGAHAVTIAPDETSLLAAHGEWKLQAWSLGAWQLQWTIPAGGAVDALACHPAGELAAVGVSRMNAGHVGFIKVVSGEPAGARIVGFNAHPRAMTFSPSGQYIALCDGGIGATWVWDISSALALDGAVDARDARILAREFRTEHGYTCASFLDDNRIVLIGSGRFSIVDLASGTKLHEVPGPSFGCAAVRLVGGMAPP